MLSFRRAVICLLAVLVVSASVARGKGVRDKLEGLVFEVEEWTTPAEAILKDRHTNDHWDLWTTEQDVWSKRSMGASLRSPTVREDRATPEDGAPPLHTHITGIPKGVYQVFVSNPGRCLAYSFDGVAWHKHLGRAELALGVFDIDDGTFDLWVDDRYATPGNPGPSYYDYIRMVPFTPPVLSHFAAYRPDAEIIQVGWISSVPMDTGKIELDHDGKWLTVGRSKETMMRNHRVDLEHWFRSQEGRFRVRSRMGPGYEYISDPVNVKMPPTVFEGEPVRQVIPLHLASSPSSERSVLAPVPLPRGQLWNAGHAWVEADTTPVPSQVQVTGRWPDGSAKWLFARLKPKPAARQHTLRIGEGAPDVPQTSNGVETSGMDALDCPFELKEISWVVADGATYHMASSYDIIEEETGPARWLTRVSGRLVDESENEGFPFDIRCSVSQSSPLAHVQLRIINDDTDHEFTRLESFSLDFSFGYFDAAEGQMPGYAGMTFIDDDWSHGLFQRTDKEYVRIDHDETVTREGRLPGWAVAQIHDQRIAVAVRDFWKTWPKQIRLEPDGIHVDILPELEPDEYRPANVSEFARHFYWFDEGCYRFKRGMALTTEFWVRVDKADDPIPEGSWDAWCQSLHELPYAAPSPEWMCKSGVFGPIEPARPGKFADYEEMVARNVRRILELREAHRAYGWMNFGDWFGERSFNWGNSEYDLSWAMAVQFARSGNWDYFRLGEEMARHHTTIDTIHVPWAERMPGRSWTHSLGHVGLGSLYDKVKLDDPAYAKWFERNSWCARGIIDYGGHIFEAGNFAYYFLTGNRNFLDAAEMVCSAQASYMTPDFRFHIERGAGWPLINAIAAYESTGNPFYLNAARIYIEKILADQSDETGSWLLPQDRSECDHPPPHLGSKTFATAILLYGMMQYDRVEPRDDVKRSIIRACDWMVDRAWNAEKKGFRYKTGCDTYTDNADTGTTSSLSLAPLGWAYQQTGDERYLAVMREAYKTMCSHTGSIGKYATDVMRQSAYALPMLRESAALRAK